MLRQFSQLCERTVNHALRDCRTVFDNCHRHFAWHSVFNQLLLNSRGLIQPHIEHQRLWAGFEVRPIGFRLAGLQAGGDKLHAVGHAARGQRDAGRGGAAGGGGHPRHHAE